MGLRDYCVIATTSKALPFAIALGAVWYAAIACIPDLPGDAPGPVAPPGCGDGFIDLSQGEQCDPGPVGDGGTATCSASCRVHCPGGFVWPNNHHCYQFAMSSERSLADGAEVACGNLGSHIATFASEEEFSQVAGHFASLASSANKELFWVGFGPNTNTTNGGYPSVAPYEPGWSVRCPGCYAHTLDPSQPLPRSDASAPTVPQNCVVASTRADASSWTQYPCTGAPLTPVLCEREPSGVQSRSCDGGICIELAWTHGAKRYVYQQMPLAPDAAAAACAALAPGARLVVLQSRDEREQLWHELAKLPSPPYSIWIGLSRVEADAGDGGIWVWDDGTRTDAPDAYPPPWAARPTITPTSTFRAYLVHEAIAQDDTLAHSDRLLAAALPFVCEVAP